MKLGMLLLVLVQGEVVLSAPGECTTVEAMDITIVAIKLNTSWWREIT